MIPGPDASPSTTGFATLALYLQDLYRKGYRGVSGGIADFSELPVKQWGYGMFACPGEGGHVWNVEVFRSLTATRQYRQINADSGSWITTDWETLATATPPEEHPLALAAGFEVFNGGMFKCCYSKAQNGLVVLHVAVNTVDRTTPRDWTQIAQLPEGYIPNGIVSVNYSDEAGGGGKLTVYANGRVEVAFATNGSIIGTVCFYAPTGP